MGGLRMQGHVLYYDFYIDFCSRIWSRMNLQFLYIVHVWCMLSKRCLWSHHSQDNEHSCMLLVVSDRAISSLIFNMFKNQYNYFILDWIFVRYSTCYKLLLTTMHVTKHSFFFAVWYLYALYYIDIIIVTLSGVYMATSPLQQKANDVRANRVNWQSYLQ